MNEEPKIETKLVKHVFTDQERLQLGTDLSNAFASKRGTEAEFDQVKAQFKSRISESDAKVETISNNIQAGFEHRKERVWVTYLPKVRKKEYRMEGSKPDSDPVLIEDMTPDDFQTDLIQAEGRFELKEELQLFIPVDSDKGVLVVGRLKDRWYSALRIRVAGRQIEERLDSEQKSVKKRPDAVKLGAKRALEWLVSSIGEKNAAGFEDSIKQVVEDHKEREE